MTNKEAIEKAVPLIEAGDKEGAEAILSQATEREPMIHYYRFYCTDNPQELMAAEVSDPEGVHPTTDMDVTVLTYAEAARRPGCYASFYLGDLYYSRGEVGKAMMYWQACAGELPIAKLHRNLAFVFWYCMDREDLARQAMENACYLDAKDLNLYLETDRLYRAMNVDPRERFLRMFPYEKTLRNNERLHLCYIELLYLLGRDAQAEEEEEKMAKIRAHKAAGSRPEGSETENAEKPTHEEELGMQKKTSSSASAADLTVDAERKITEELIRRYEEILELRSAGSEDAAAEAAQAMKREGLQLLQTPVKDEKNRSELDGPADFAMSASRRNQRNAIFELALATLAEGNAEQAKALAEQGLTIDKNHLELHRIARGLLLL